MIDTGPPTIVLHLAENPGYAQKGLPENRSPSSRDGLVLASEAAAEPSRRRRPTTPPTATPTSQRLRSRSRPRPTPPKTTGNKPRKPAFVVPGAPAEPLDEMPLPDRARLLEKRLAAQRKPTPELVNYWLYQHSWIVTGAKFGWSGGAEALRILVRVDTSLQARWGSARRAQPSPRAALAEVERRQAN